MNIGAKINYCDIFCKIMSRDRYKVLLRTLHFADDHECNSDRLWKIREIINRLRKSFPNAILIKTYV